MYENSPLADYLQGSFHAPHSEYHPLIGPGEGEGEGNWPVEESHSEDESNFAPRGASRFQARVRNKLPKPLDLNNSRHGAVVEKIYSTCTVWPSSAHSPPLKLTTSILQHALNARLGRGDNERFLEQFGYVIVASQLLNEHSAPSYTSAADVASAPQSADLPSLSTTFGLHGAIVTAGTSFSIAWLLHWGRSRAGSGISARRVGVLVILVPVLGLLFYAFAKRQWLKYLRHQAVEAAGNFIGNAQGFDSAASASVMFIQEVELVSRGYRM